MSFRFRIVKAHGSEEWAERATTHFVEEARDAIAARGLFRVVLSGGSTPRAALERIAALPPASNEWDKVHIFFGDERCVGPESPESNYRMVREALLDRLPVAAAQVLRIEGERDPLEAARVYNDQLDVWLQGRRERFDLVVLGLGADGHSASLLPDRPLLYTAGPWVAVGPGPGPEAEGKPLRVTLTPEALRRTRSTVLWVRGADKAPVVRAALRGGGPPTVIPELLPPDGRVTWILDEDAASLL